MRLVEQGGKFWTHKTDRHGVGLTFRCPCSPSCHEHVSVALANPMDGGEPEPSSTVRWTRSGDTIDTLTLTPSIDFRHCVGDTDVKTGWHGFVRNGELVSA